MRRRRASLELVVVDAPIGVEGQPRPGYSIVQSDHAGGAHAATAHLLSLGHRTVHLVAGPRLVLRGRRA